MNKRIATKIVKDRVLPAFAVHVADGAGFCYSDRERQAARVFVRHRINRIVRLVKETSGGCIEASRLRARAKI